MPLFGKRISAARQLDEILNRIQMNFENNYKDAAQMNLRELEAKYQELSLAGRLSEHQKSDYSDRLEELRERMKNFTHKDQKATWT